MTPLKPFQAATVKAAFSALTDRRRKVNRFLVADEVGLGKTVVAQHVLKRLIDARSEPLKVFYVCSSLSIAGQNRARLLQVLPEAERSLAVCEVDRLTLLPASAPPSHRQLRLYTLTPDTSVPVRQGRRRDGRQEERALVQALIEDAYPDLIGNMGWGPDFFRRNAESRWSTLLDAQRQRIAGGRLRSAFKDAVRQAFDLQPQQWLQRRLRDFDDSLEVIARFRNALAIQALNQLRPDLVIFDEFQKFRDLIDESLDDAAARIVQILRGDEGSALLMLSATPYSLLTTRQEDSSGAAHHSQLLDLVSFLYGRGETGNRKADECRQAFSQLEHAFYQGAFQTAEAQEAVRQIERLLRPVIARTERMMHPLGRQDGGTSSLPANLVASDFRAYRHFAGCLDTIDRTFAAAYWSSIPLPMQTMGSRYQAWQRAQDTVDPHAPGLSSDHRDRFEHQAPWPHPKLRSLFNLVTPSTLSLPWIKPSLPWWPMAGPWKAAAADRGKVLLFSRFRAVPPAVSALLSYEMERQHVRRSGLAYADVSKRRMLQATGERMPLLAAFHPCPFLVQGIDPLEAKSPSIGLIRKSIRRQLTRTLTEELGVEIQPRTGRPRPVWQLLAGLECQAGTFVESISAWQSLWRRMRATPEGTSADAEGSALTGLAKLLETWSKVGTKPILEITPAELDLLSQHAWSAPGVVLGRALVRHWSDASDATNFGYVLEASWQGLRNYLDQRWFASVLGGSERNYLRSLQGAVVDGNLESVLDEWFWMLKTTAGRQGRELCDEVVGIARLRGSDVRFHELGAKGEHFSLRAHAALPFVDARQASIDLDADARPLRNDELRRAFNSPFYPHVLATTSVGQEGLDFHAWCRTVLHWDLAPNAADLEQREGRIQRFAGLAIRREVAKCAGKAALDATPSRCSPWANLELAAERDWSDDSGLAPWWVFADAQIERFVPDIPTSEQRARLEQLHAQRGLYRMVLGQPHQEDLMAVLRRQLVEGRAVPDHLVPVLSPFFAREGDDQT